MSNAPPRDMKAQAKLSTARLVLRRPAIDDLDEIFAHYASDAWGHGFATEVVCAMKITAARAGVQRLSACCHPDHGPSRRVLEKCGFALDGTLRQYCEFPNLAPGELLDAVSYSWSPELKPGVRL